MDEMRYELKHLSLDQLNAEIDKWWQKLSTDPQLRREALEADIDLRQLTALGRTDAIVVKRDGAGFDYTPIIVAFAPVVAKIAADVWTKIILPRIGRKEGMDVVTPVRAPKK